MRISWLVSALVLVAQPALGQAPSASARRPDCPCPRRSAPTATTPTPPPVVIDTVIPGSGYDIGVIQYILGTHYRKLWTTPIAVPVLDLEHFAGGLQPVKRGGGRQTISLRLKGRDGVEYKFRSVDKEPANALPRGLRKSIVEQVFQDQMSAQYPAANLIASRLLDAAGVPHTRPELYVMPDDPALGAFRQEFAGMLGTIEPQRPELPGARDFVDTQEFFDSLRADPTAHIEAREYLRARLMDILMGDWDRHSDQWEWASVPDEHGATTWRPVPQDRDWAFSRLDGWLATFVRQYYPQTIGFEQNYPPMLNLTWTGKELDRRLLSSLHRSDWDSIAGDLQRRITDSVISGAVAAQPPALAAKGGVELQRALRKRRDHLAKAAEEFYRLINKEVDVHGTDGPEHAVVQHDENGVEITMGSGPLETYRRRFVPDETREVRLYLHGGADTAVVRGKGSEVLVRLVGEPSDVLLDSSRGDTRLYRDPDQGIKRPPISTKKKSETPPTAQGEKKTKGVTGEVQTRSEDFAPAPRTPALLLAGPMDWGHRWISVPWAEFHPGQGIVLGMKADRYRWGFRALPYRTHVRLKLGWAFGAAGPTFETLAESRQLFWRLGGRIQLKASKVETVRYFGFGNETAPIKPGRDARHIQDFIRIQAPLLIETRHMNFSVGPMLKLTRPHPLSGSLLALESPLGTERLVLGGIDGTLGLTAGKPIGQGLGAMWAWQTTAARAVSGPDAHFVRTHMRLAAYYTPDLPAKPTIALRAGGQKVWGLYPFAEAATLGGEHDLRGYDKERFRGDASAYVGSEIRTRLLHLGGADVGVTGLADAGRVFLNGETSSTWHYGYGMGLWAGRQGSTVANLVAAHSVEKTLQLHVYLGIGF